MLIAFIWTQTYLDDRARTLAQLEDRPEFAVRAGHYEVDEWLYDQWPEPPLPWDHLRWSEALNSLNLIVRTLGLYSRVQDPASGNVIFCISYQPDTRCAEVTWCLAYKSSTRSSEDQVTGSDDKSGFWPRGWGEELNLMRNQST